MGHREPLPSLQPPQKSTSIEPGRHGKRWRLDLAMEPHQWLVPLTHEPTIPDLTYSPSSFLVVAPCANVFAESAR